MPCLAPVPLAVFHELAQTNVYLAPDGSLSVSDRPENGLGVQFMPEEVLALATFFRMPGVMPLIERADAERQPATEIGFQESQREEAELVASGFYDRNRGEAPPA